MIVKKLKNGFTKLKCEYCDYALSVHQSGNFEHIKHYLVVHSLECICNPSNNCCYTCGFCKHGYLMAPSTCKVTKETCLPYLTHRPCWQPRLSIFKRIMNIFVKVEK